MNRKDGIIILIVLTCLAVIPTVKADNESLYVDGYNSVNEEWDETGASPWLNDNDANYISTSTDNEIHEEFTFGAPAGSDTINSVTLYIEVQGPSARNDYVVIDVYDGSSWSLVAEQDPDDDAYSWYNFDVSGVFDTWQKITDAKLRVTYERAGSPSTQTIYVRRAYLYVDYTPAGVNNDPVNDQCSITNRDDTDKLYAQRPAYTIDYDGHDADGYADIDYILVNITQDATIRASFKYDEDLNTFSIIDGDDKYELISGSCSASRAGNNVNLTIAFQVEFDAIVENDVELKASIYDDEPTSDTDTMQTNYADIITDLVTTFSLNDDRGNIGQSVTASGAITYPGSSLYPPDGEFTSVSVYDLANNNEGTDPTIVNGVWEVIFSAPGTVGIDTYNLYINMVDADYTDGEESPTDNFITDRILVYYQELNDTRTDLNTNIEFRAKAILEYDNHFLGAGDALTANFGALSWDAGNDWFDGLRSEATVTDYTFQISSGNEGSYGITSITTNQSNPVGIWDRVNVTLSTPDNRINTGLNASIVKTSVYAYDGTPHAGAVALNETEVKNTVGNYTYTTASIVDTNYGLTLFITDYTWCIFDKQQLQTLAGNNSNPDANQPVRIWATAQSLFDGHVLSAGDSLTLKDTDTNTYIMAYNGSHWVWIGSWGSNGTITINTYDTVNEATFSISILDMNGLSLVITVGSPPAPPSGYTLNLRVIDSNGNGLFEISVLIENATYTFFNGLTNSTGFIPEQSLDSGSYEITISKEEYITNEIELNLIGNLYLISKLLTIEEFELMPFDTTLLVLIVVTLVFQIVSLSTESLTVGLSSVFICFVGWIACMGYFMAENTDHLYLGWFFFLLAILNLMFAFYGAITALNVYRNKRRGLIDEE